MSFFDIIMKHFISGFNISSSSVSTIENKTLTYHRDRGFPLRWCPEEQTRRPTVWRPRWGKFSSTFKFIGPLLDICKLLWFSSPKNPTQSPLLIQFHSLCFIVSRVFHTVFHQMLYYYLLIMFPSTYLNQTWWKWWHDTQDLKTPKDMSWSEDE